MTVDHSDNRVLAGRRRVDLLIPAAAYLSVAVLVTAIQYAAQPGGRGIDDVWIRYDAGAYITIARSGYSWSASDPVPLVAWFPGYPLVIRAVTTVLGDEVRAAVAITFASGLAAACMMWSWMASHAMSVRDRAIGLAVLLLFAWGWFLYGVVYGDALFLALALGAFVLSDRRRLVGATLLAAAATAERPTGVALVVGLVVGALEADGVLSWRGWSDEHSRRRRFPVGVSADRFRPRQLVPLLAVIGLVAYSAYLGVRFGRPLLWLEAQERWHQGPGAGPASWFKLHMGAMVVKNHDPAYLAKSIPQLVAVVAALCAVPSVCRRFGLGPGAYVGTLMVIVAVGTNDFVGPGRYLIAAFPLAALLAEWLGPRRIATAAWLGISATALVVQTALFARDVYLT